MKNWQPWQVRRRFEHVAQQLVDGKLTLDHSVTVVPHAVENNKASALGWVGHFFEVPGGSGLDAVLGHVGLPDAATFETRMDAIDPQWRQSPTRTAAALMRYAATHHPDVKP